MAWDTGNLGHILSQLLFAWVITDSLNASSVSNIFRIYKSCFDCIISLIKTL